MEKQPPVFLLPWELLRIVFLYLEDVPGSRHCLAAVCRPWRDIINAMPSFWTHLSIFPQHPISSSEAMDRLQALVEKTGTSLVNINWHCTLRSDDLLCAQLASYLLESISLSRWRSLVVGRIGDVSSYELCGSFDGLQHLTVEYHEAEPIIAHINSTSNQLLTVKLRSRVLDKLPSNILVDVVGENTTLHTEHLCPQLEITQKVGGLHIHAWLPYIGGPLPIVRELVIDTFYFTDGPLIATKFPNLERLTLQRVYSGSHPYDYAIFPNLRYLHCTGPSFSYLSRIEALSLETLHLTSWDSKLSSQTLDDALDSPTYELSPITLHLDLSIDLSTTIHILSLSPKLQSLSLSVFDNQQWLSLPIIFLRHRIIQADYAKGEGTMKWELCDGLAFLEFRIQTMQTSQSVLDARKIAEEILDVRPLRQICVVWADENTMIFKGEVSA